MPTVMRIGDFLAKIEDELPAVRLWSTDEPRTFGTGQILHSKARSMTYELARQLKDAGFPQEGQLWWFATSIGENGRRKQLWKRVRKGAYQESATSERCVDPTLPDLIKACGENRFFQLSKTGSDLEVYGDDLVWHATTVDADKWFGGSTAEEAVARLWIALQTSETRRPD